MRYDEWQDAFLAVPKGMVALWFGIRQDIFSRHLIGRLDQDLSAFTVKPYHKGKPLHRKPGECHLANTTMASPKPHMTSWVTAPITRYLSFLSCSMAALTSASVITRPISRLGLQFGESFISALNRGNDFWIGVVVLKKAWALTLDHRKQVFQFNERRP